MDYILPVIYFLISLFSFYYSWKGFSTKKAVFKKGMFGTRYEDSVKLAFIQSLMLLLLALCAALYGYFALLFR